MKELGFQFRAVTIEDLEDHSKGYESVPLESATEPFHTVGVYKDKELEGGDGIIVQDHVIDMSIEEFKKVQESRFPNGFESWQETHFEIVAQLVTMRKGGDVPEFLHQVQKDLGRCGFYSYAKLWADEFEKLHAGREWDGEFFDELDYFVERKVYGDEEQSEAIK